MEEIKPCPCCGDVAWQAENKKGTKICIQCLNPDCGLRTAWYLTYIEALGAWNRRQEAQAAQSEPPRMKVFFNGKELKHRDG